MDGAVSVAGVADLKICYSVDRAGYIYETNAHTHRTHTYLPKCTQGRAAPGQILTEEKAMRREESVPDELVDVHVNDTSDLRLWTP